MKPKVCANCSRLFQPKLPMQSVCGYRCVTAMALAKQKARKAQERAQTKERRKALETIPELIKAAQKEFNAYIRARDAGKACICCGRHATSDSLRGGDWDCGHYRSTGSAPHLRFDERNAHRQLKACNRYGAGRAVDYRIGLIQRIGMQAVESLESDNGVHKWTREELREIRDTYRAKLKELRRVECPSQSA